MSADSRHLGEAVQAARVGAHLVLRGHLRDEVVLRDRVVTERWGLAKVLQNDAGLEAVLFLDAAEGLYCSDRATREKVEGAMCRAPARHDVMGAAIVPQLGQRTAIDLGNAILALMRQDELAVAVVMDDTDILINPADEQGRRAVGLVRRAAAEAACVRGRGSLAPRNMLIAMDSPPGAIGEELARMPGVRVLDVSPPDRAMRATLLAMMARGFYGAGRDRDATRRGLELLADRMIDCSVRDLEQLRRLSHERRVPASRPATLLAARSGRAHLNPVARVGVDEIMRELQSGVVGQQAAHERMRALLQRATSASATRAHGSVPTKPLMTMLAFGPAGVGKTETARTLARVLFGSENACVRIDCGEYRNPQDVARLTGAPPGYVGHESGGQLSEPLRRGPAVVLFDEFEKAKEDTIVNLLLSILDDGRLTDGRGETLSFAESIVLFTTNIGSKELNARYGLADGELPRRDDFLTDAERLVRERIAKPENKGMGRPELLSRLGDSLIPFDFLRADALAALTQKLCANIAANLGDELDVELNIDAAPFVEVFGGLLEGRSWDGRDVERYARAHIEVPLRDRLREFPARQGRVIADHDGLATILGRAGGRRSAR